MPFRAISGYRTALNNTDTVRDLVESYATRRYRTALNNTDTVLVRSLNAHVTGYRTALNNTDTVLQILEYESMFVKILPVAFGCRG